MSILDALVEELVLQPKRSGEISVQDLVARGVSLVKAQRTLVAKVKAGELKRRRGVENGRRAWFYSEA